MNTELIQHMGTDLTVVNAARVSFDKESSWCHQGGEPDVDGVHGVEEQVLGDKDQKLLNYLAKHNHWTPFSHVMITMRETVPIFVARQRFKHMVGFTYNEVSRRYVDDEPEFYSPEAWRKAAENKKQGSSEETIEYCGPDGKTGLRIDLLYKAQIGACKAMYKSFLEAGVAPEQARMVLPQSMYTSYYATGSLSAWARAYKLRSDPHSQMEIQELAKQWHQIIETIEELKYSWKALTNG
jgi:thymidylate synthase (FAD)